jgi:hypothetical protein
LPDLASSLNNLGNRLSDLGQREAALAASKEAVVALKQHFLQLPLAYLSWMQTMTGNYLKRCEESGVEVDRDMLVAINVKFQELEQGSA